jgi:hypothetical protein
MTQSTAETSPSRLSNHAPRCSRSLQCIKWRNIIRVTSNCELFVRTMGECSGVLPVSARECSLKDKDTTVRSAGSKIRYTVLDNSFGVDIWISIHYFHQMISDYHVTRLSIQNKVPELKPKRHKDIQGRRGMAPRILIVDPKGDKQVGTPYGYFLAREKGPGYPYMGAGYIGGVEKVAKGETSVSARHKPRSSKLQPHGALHQLFLTLTHVVACLLTRWSVIQITEAITCNLLFARGRGFTKSLNFRRDTLRTVNAISLRTSPLNMNKHCWKWTICHVCVRGVGEETLVKVVYSTRIWCPVRFWC